MILTGFKDRTDAGRALAQRLEGLAGRKDLVVLGLPRGGIPVAYEIAKSLQAPLDAFVVGKLGVPGAPELALGAVASGGLTIFNAELLEELEIPRADVDAIVQRKLEEVDRREARYRQGAPAALVEGRTVILADDGAATGASMRAALQALRKLNPLTVLAAVPVASEDALQALRMEADEVVCLQTPHPFHAVGQWYEDFRQVSDEEVIRYLEWARGRSGRSGRDGGIPPAKAAPQPVSQRIQAGGAALRADLTLPRDAAGMILFAHGSGSGRRSPRNRRVARFLNEAGFATLLLDLLTEEEERDDRETGRYRFDIGLLAGRLLDATRWARADSRLSNLPFGYFGASTGAAAALIAAARSPGEVGAVVSRGGRPDLAGEGLADVSAPTLLIVGEEDGTVLGLNRRALESLRCERSLATIPGATHLFEEPGALDQVSRLAGDWFTAHLRRRRKGSDASRG